MVIPLQRTFPPSHHSQEAAEVMADASGRWFLFKVDLDTVFVLERKGLPEHMAGLDVVEQPTAFGDLLRTLEDAGEARVSYANTIQIK